MTEVLVALIAALGIVAAGTVPVVVSTRRTRKVGEAAVDTAQVTQDRIGTPNGKGNVVEMLEKILNGQTGQDQRLAELERGQSRTHETLQRVDNRLGVLEAGAVAGGGDRD